jgi:hypothetical protein
MNLARTFRSPIAWMLLCFILFNGLACSIGHGQMLAAFSSAPPVMACGDHQDASAPMDMSTMGDHALLMKLAMSDCAFAATLALPSIFLIQQRTSLCRPAEQGIVQQFGDREYCLAERWEPKRHGNGYVLDPQALALQDRIAQSLK